MDDRYPLGIPKPKDTKLPPLKHPPEKPWHPPGFTVDKDGKLGTENYKPESPTELPPKGKP